MTALKRVLVVEDEPLIAMDLAGTLEELGYEVGGFAQTQTEALHKLASSPPDIVTLDVNLGHGRDGLDIAAYLRAKGELPIVFVTGQAERDIGEFVQNLGHAALVLKPIDTFAPANALAKVCP